jgi:HAD superfamily hydrolase (TIGR01509 family)
MTRHGDGSRDGCDLVGDPPGTVTVPVATDLVIFDCDGVLVDSEELQARVLMEVLLEHGVDRRRMDDVLNFRGGKLGNVVSAIEEETGTRLPDGIVLEIRARTAAVFEKELRPIDGIVDVLEGLTVPYCVASNGPREKMVVSLGCCGLLGLFENRMFSAYDVGSWKPAPDLFFHAARSMGIAPARTTVVEDSSLGVQAGVAAGMNVLGFAPPARALELTSFGAARVFWPMHALAELLGTSETR